LNIPKTVYQKIKDDIKNRIQSDIPINKNYLLESFSFYTNAEMYFLEYSMIKDLEPELKDLENFKIYKDVLFFCMLGYENKEALK
jgi:hypothetical protein